MTPPQTFGYALGASVSIYSCFEMSPRLPGEDTCISEAAWRSSSILSAGQYTTGAIRHTSMGCSRSFRRRCRRNGPTPHFAVNQLLRDTAQDLGECQQELEQVYYCGVCSWPFSHGGVSYGERQIQVGSEPMGLLRHLAKSKPRRKVIRLYQQGFALFWRWNGRLGKGGRNRLAPDTIALIRQTLPPHAKSLRVPAHRSRLERCGAGGRHRCSGFLPVEPAPEGHFPADLLGRHEEQASEITRHRQYHISQHPNHH